MLADGFHDVPKGKVATIVTHLEMRTAQMRGATLPDGLEFTTLPRDLAAYRDILRRVGQQWLWFGRLLLDDAELSKIIDDPLVELYTLTKDCNPEAILELDFRVTGECELAFFGLTGALIGSGAGAYLMDQAVSKAFRAGITRFHVHTCTLDSPQALGFYRRSGFTPIRQQVEVADDPRILGIHPQDAGPHIPFFGD